MLAKLSIRAKLVAVVSMLLVSPAAIGGFGLLQMRSQNAYLMDIQTSWLPSVQTLGELRANTITYRVVVRDLVALTDPEARAKTEKTLETVTQAIDKVRTAYEPLITSEEERNIYKEFSQAWNSYTAEARDIIAMAAKGQNNEARELNSSKVNPIGLKADAALRKDVELNKKGATDAAGAAEQEYSRASNVTDVNRGAGETGSASTQVFASAQSLSKESGQLRLEVDKFLTAMRAA